MAYLSLALKYRPGKFSDLVGQDVAVRALRNSIRLQRFAQGVIFAGVRGIGKTSSARIYAKALNCELPNEGEPCDQCQSCLLIRSGRHEDVHEVDGASNNGVEEVRSLLEGVHYKPQRSRYRVYIIDEVHMLSVNAFNALLKTLEEPPAHAVFVLATTELHKVPKTVIGRCQTYHLQKMTHQQAVDRIRWILEQESIRFEESAIQQIAREGDGSMRDALTLLEQVIALGDGEVQTHVLNEFISGVSTGVCFQFMCSVVQRDAQRLLAGIDYLDKRGVRFREFLTRLIQWVRHCFIARQLGEQSTELGALGLREEDLQKFMGFVRSADTLDFHKIFRLLKSCYEEMDGSALDRFVLENNLFEWCLNVENNPNGEEKLKPRGESRLSQIRSELSQSKTAVSQPNAHDAQAAQVMRQATPTPSVSAQIAQRATKPTEGSSTHRSSSHSSARFDAPMAPKAPIQLAPPVAPSAIKEEENISSSPLASNLTEPKNFPKTWNDLFFLWKEKRRFRAAKFTEAVPVEFGWRKIQLGFVPGDMALRELTNEGQQRILSDWKEMVGFQGEFEIKIDESFRNSTVTAGANILAQRQEQRLKMEDELRSSHIAQGFMQTFNGECGEIHH